MKTEIKINLKNSGLDLEFCADRFCIDIAERDDDYRLKGIRRIEIPIDYEYLDIFVDSVALWKKMREKIEI